MAVQTVVKTVGTTGVFSTPQLWEDGGPVVYTTAEKSAAGTFLVAAFAQGEAITFVGSGATGKLLDTDSTGAGTGTYLIYSITSGNIAASDVATGGTSGATCVITSGTPDHVGVIWQGQQQNQEFAGTGNQLTGAGGTTSTAAYPHYTTVAGASFRNHASVQSNALKYDATLGAAIRGTSSNTATVTFSDQGRISGLQITATGAGGRALGLSENDSVVEFCILEGNYIATSSALGVLYWTANQTGAIIRNTLIIQRTSAADHIVGTSAASPSFFNCTIVAADDLATAPAAVFLSGASGTVTVTNCALFAGGDVPTGAGSATFTYTTCYGDDSTPATGITAAAIADQFENVDDATRDFRVKTGAGLIDTGTTDATHGPIDIAGTARPSGAAYDVGCWEFVAAAGGGASVTGGFALMGVQ